MDIFFIIGGLVGLFFAGDLLVKNSVILAKKYDIPNVVIALTVVAFGTSAPEFIVSINAGIKGFDDIILGNILGSNIANLFLIIGVSALISPVVISKDKQSFQDVLYIAVVTSFLTMFAIADLNINIFEGLLLLVSLMIYVRKKYTLVQSERKDRKELLEHELNEEFDILKATEVSFTKLASMILLSLSLLFISANFTVEGAVGLARGFGVPEAVIALTIVAIGSSLPELAASITAARRGHSDMVLGNVIGSNFLNIVLGLGLVSVFKEISVSEKFISYDLLYFLISGLVLLLLYKTTDKINRLCGLAFIIFFVSFLMIQLVSSGLL